MKFIITAAVVLSVFAGIAEEKKSHEPAPGKYKKSVRVETNPPGLRVFVGYGADLKNAIKRAEYVGQSPCTAEVVTDSRGRVEIRNTITLYNKAIQPVLVFIARGEGTNGMEVTQSFKGGALLRGSDDVPAAIFLDAAKP